MAGSMQIENGRGGNGWRVAMWGGAAGLLLIPAIAMQMTSEVRWGPEDFLTMAVMLVLACSAFELAVRTIRGTTACGLAGIAILGIFLLVWAELAVGIFH